MTILIPVGLVYAKSAAALKANDIFYAKEPRLEQVVGRRTSPPREPGIRFAHPGFHEVWVNADGPGMSYVRLGLARRIDWKQYLSELGLNAGHASARQIAVAASPIPLFRNKLSLSGVKGLPSGHGKAWTVTFQEYAIVDYAKKRVLKARILSTPVGPARNELIKGCYDWWSELDFARG